MYSVVRAEQKNSGPEYIGCERTAVTFREQKRLINEAEE